MFLKKYKLEISIAVFVIVLVILIALSQYYSSEQFASGVEIAPEPVVANADGTYGVVSTTSPNNYVLTPNQNYVGNLNLYYSISDGVTKKYNTMKVNVLPAYNFTMTTYAGIDLSGIYAKNGGTSNVYNGAGGTASVFNFTTTDLLNASDVEVDPNVTPYVSLLSIPTTGVNYLTINSSNNRTLSFSNANPSSISISVGDQCYVGPIALTWTISDGHTSITSFSAPNFLNVVANPAGANTLTEILALMADNSPNGAGQLFYNSRQGPCTWSGWTPVVVNASQSAVNYMIYMSRVPFTTGEGSMINVICRDGSNSSTTSSVAYRISALSGTSTNLIAPQAVQSLGTFNVPISAYFTDNGSVNNYGNNWVIAPAISQSPQFCTYNGTALTFSTNGNGNSCSGSSLTNPSSGVLNSQWGSSNQKGYNGANYCDGGVFQNLYSASNGMNLVNYCYITGTYPYETWIATGTQNPPHLYYYRSGYWINNGAEVYTINNNTNVYTPSSNVGIVNVDLMPSGNLIGAGTDGNIYINNTIANDFSSTTSSSNKLSWVNAEFAWTPLMNDPNYRVKYVVNGAGWKFSSMPSGTMAPGSCAVM